MAECPHVSRLEGVDITKLQEEMKDFYERIVMGKEYYNGGQYVKNIDLGEEYGLEQKVFGEKSLETKDFSEMNDIEKTIYKISNLEELFHTKKKYPRAYI